MVVRSLSNPEPGIYGSRGIRVRARKSLARNRTIPIPSDDRSLCVRILHYLSIRRSRRSSGRVLLTSIMAPSLRFRSYYGVDRRCTIVVRCRLVRVPFDSFPSPRHHFFVRSVIFYSLRCQIYASAYIYRFFFYTTLWHSTLALQSGPSLAIKSRVSLRVTSQATTNYKTNNNDDKLSCSICRLIYSNMARTRIYRTANSNAVKTFYPHKVNNA